MGPKIVVVVVVIFDKFLLPRFFTLCYYYYKYARMYVGMYVCMHVVKNIHNFYCQTFTYIGTFKLVHNYIHTSLSARKTRTKMMNSL